MKETRYFYGYNVVAASFVIQGISIGSMFAYGVLFAQFEAEFGWSRATISAASSITFLTMGVFGVLAGRLNDTIGPRLLLSVSAVSLGLGFALMSRMQAPWQLFVFYGLLVGIGLSTHDVVTLSTIARWFVRRRGAMSGLVKVGTGCGQVVIPLVAAALIASSGWRTACLTIGVSAGVLLMLAAQVMRRDPHGMGLAPDNVTPARGASGGAPAVADITLARAIRARALWTLCIAQLTVFFCLVTVMVHIVPHGIDLGLSAPIAASVLSAIGGFSIVGRLVVGSAIDRIGGRHALMICFVVLLASLAWLQVAMAPWMLFVFAAVYGFAHGGFFTVMSPTVAELFGTASHGVLFGIVLFFGTLGGAIGPWVAGSSFDATGSYRTAFVTLAVLAAIGLTLVSSLKRREPVARASRRPV